MQPLVDARRLLTLLLVGLAIALPVAFVSSQYLGNDVDAVLSYSSQDVGCSIGAYPGLGHHCFGDYSQSLVAAQHDFALTPTNPWPAARAYVSIYPPISQFPHVLSALAQETPLGTTGTFYAYEGLLLLAVLAPALWLVWAWRSSPLALVPLLLIGLATVPAIAAMDRSNSAAFVVPFLLGFALLLRRGPPWAAATMAVGAALVRPQFILIALALVAIGRVRAALGALATFLLVTLASFLLVPTGVIGSFREWIHNIASFRSGSVTLTDPTPANISIARSATSLGGWFADRPGPVGAFGRWVVAITVAHPILPGVVLLCLTAAIFFLGRTRIPQSVAVAVAFAVAATFSTMSPIYYLAFTLVLAAVTIWPAIGGVRTDALTAAREACPAPPGWWRWALAVAVGLSLTPLALARAVTPRNPVFRNAVVLEQIGKVWLVVILATLLWILVRDVRRRRRRVLSA